MNLKNFAAFFFLSAAAASAQGTDQVVYAESPASLNLALILKSEAPGLLVNGEELYEFTGPETINRQTGIRSITTTQAGRISASRYGNREFLIDLLNAGELPIGESEDSIGSWGLFVTGRNEEGRGAVAIEARKLKVTVTGRGKKRVVLTEVLAQVPLSGSNGLGLVNLFIEPVVGSYSLSQTENYSLVGTNRVGEFLTGGGSFSDEGVAYLTFAGLQTEEYEVPAIEGTGSMTESGNYFYYYPDPNNRTNMTYVVTSRGVTISSIVGGLVAQEDPESEDAEPLAGFLLNGSVTLGPTTAVVVTNQ
jgi:hypothetical protein